MRLTVLDHGHQLKTKALFGLIRVMTRHPVPDVVKTLMYRERFFGKPQSALTHQVMRGPSEWSIGERELMAAFVSRTNQCSF